MVSSVGLKAERLKMGADVESSSEGGNRASEVWLEGKVAEVGGKGVVAGGREEYVSEVKGLLVLSLLRRGGGGGGVVMGDVKRKNEDCKNNDYGK